MSKRKYIYFTVSQDEFEHPQIIAETAQELADVCGVTKGAVIHAIKNYEKGMLKTKFRRIPREEK